jgi:hypothetical protein
MAKLPGGEMTEIYQFRGIALRLEDIYTVGFVTKPNPKGGDDKRKTLYYFGVDLAVPHVGKQEWRFYFQSARSANYYRNQLIAEWVKWGKVDWS